MNGPEGEFGKELGINPGEMLDLAFKIFHSGEINRRTTPRFSKLDYKKHCWGEAASYSDEAVALINAELERKDKAEEKKRLSRQFLSAAAVEEAELVEAMEKEAIRTAGPEQVKHTLYKDADGADIPMVKALGANGLELEECFLDYDDAGYVMPGTRIVMTGFGGFVWHDCVSTAHLEASVVFAGDRSTWTGKLKISAYGPANVNEGYGGNPATVTMGWMVLGKAVPMRAQSQSGISVDSGGGGIGVQLHQPHLMVPLPKCTGGNSQHREHRGPL